MSRTPRYEKELIELFTQIHDPSVMKAFLEDILTPAEFDALTLRLQLVKMIDEGVPQREIAETLGIGIAKVTRGSRVLRNPKGGFRTILDRYYKK